MLRKGARNKRVYTCIEREIPFTWNSRKDQSNLLICRDRSIPVATEWMCIWEIEWGTKEIDLGDGHVLDCSSGDVGIYICQT